MQNLAYIYDSIFLEHNAGKYHPERKQRLEAVHNLIQNSDIWNHLTHLTSQPATPGQIALAHDPDLVKFNMSQRGKNNVMLDLGDTFMSEKSMDAVENAVGAAIKCVDLVLENQFKRAFAAVRPPGHHAEYQRSMGFCIFNNIAIAAAHALQQYSIDKILIIDWDVHHGNGTQDIFYSRNDVFYLSMHQVPLFPGSGYERETGTGIGQGYTLNYPLSAGKDDVFYQDLLHKALTQIQTVFIPDLVMISAGFDAHGDDPIGGMRLTENGFAKLTEIVVNFAEKHCNGKIVSVLEGGYDLEGLAASVVAHLNILKQV
ncbi:MAG: histone deacetylase [Calditrichae bacterium]|nr:histone deacetylase [Calditrichia bacterium]